jgi:hypothetical protein
MYKLYIEDRQGQYHGLREANGEEILEVRSHGACSICSMEEHCTGRLEFACSPRNDPSPVYIFVELDPMFVVLLQIEEDEG